MTDESSKAQQNDFHPKHVGNTEDSAFSAFANLPWRRLGRFFMATVLVGFVLNEIWEMTQMSAYVETADRSWMSTFGLCTRAAVGDVGIILAIYAVGACVARNLCWGLRDRWSIYSTTAILGLASAALVEYMALTAGRWSYAERMPVVSVLGMGLWPLLQMTILPPLTFWISRWWACGSATKSAL